MQKLLEGDLQNEDEYNDFIPPGMNLGGEKHIFIIFIIIVIIMVPFHLLCVWKEYEEFLNM